MSDTDKWFSTLSFGQKLSVLGYSKNWDYKTCAEMTSAELIVTIGFPPLTVSNRFVLGRIRNLFQGHFKWLIR